MPEHWRSKIQTGNLLTRLNNHAQGKIEMTSSQIKAAEILLKKTMPDLKQTDMSRLAASRSRRSSA